MAHLLARSVCNDAGSGVNPGYAKRQQAVERALEYISSSSDALRVSDVYQYSAVSWRTLDRAFKERFGITPKQYIVATRLSGARKALAAAPPETRISDIANDWGFWHLGRFASDYNRMFGELPSATLRR